MRTRAAGWAVMMVATVAIITGASSVPARAASDAPVTCSNEKWTSVGQLPSCPKPDPTPGQKAPKTQPQSSSAPKSQTSPGPSAQPSYKPAFDGEEPVMAPDQWAKRLAEGVQGLGSEFNRLMEKGFGTPQISAGFVQLYSLLFGLGLLLAAFATMMATKDIARNKETARETTIHAYSRLLLFVPLMAAAPFAISVFYDIANGLAAGFMQYGQEELAKSIAWVVGILGTVTLAAPVVPGGMAVLIGICLFLGGCLLAILIELAIAQYLVYVLALMIPVIFAASINPRWHGGVKKLTGGLIGALLTPAALALTWAVFASAIHGGGVTQDGILKRLVLIGAALLASLAAPIIVGILLSYLIPAFAEWHDADRRAARYAVANAVANRQRGGSKSSPGGDLAKGTRVSKSQNASASEKAKLPVDSASAAGGGNAGGAAGAAGSAGVVGAAVAAFAKIVKGTKQTGDRARDSAGGAAHRQGVPQGDAPRASAGRTNGGGSRTERGGGAEPPRRADAASASGQPQSSSGSTRPRSTAGTGTPGRDRTR